MCTHTHTHTHSTVPSLELNIQPSLAVAVDTAPYNSFTLNCTGSAPDGIVATKAFEWREITGNSQTSLVHNGDAVYITDSGLDKPLSTSELRITGKPVGTYLYICISTIQVPGGLNVTASATATATVQGKLDYVHYMENGISVTIDEYL